MVLVFFFKRKTAYELGISDWSSDVALPIYWPMLVDYRAVSSGNAIVLNFGAPARFDLSRTGRAASAVHAELGVAGNAAVALSVPGGGAARHFRLGKRIVGSEERRVGKECGSTCRSRWSPYH